MSGISFQHKVNDLYDPTKSFVVKKLLEGCKRIRRSNDIRAPITTTVLGKIISILPQICISPYEAQLFRAAYLLAYFGLMRVSELVYTNALHAVRPLFYSDITITSGAEAMLISIRVSKTNQRGPATTIRIPRLCNNDLCPVKAMQNFLKLRPSGSQHQYLLCHSNGSPLTRSQFSGVLVKSVRALGLPTHIYTPHSFRIGRASVLAAEGVSHDDIKTLGRWKSSVFKRYIQDF